MGSRHSPTGGPLEKPVEPRAAGKLRYPAACPAGRALFRGLRAGGFVRGSHFVSEIAPKAVRRLSSAVLVASTIIAGFLTAATSPAAAQSSSPQIVLLTTGGNFVGLTTDASGDVFATNPNDGVVDEVLPDGSTQLIAGGGSEDVTTTPIPATSASLGLPTGIAVDPTTGNIYVADAGIGDVFEISGGEISLVAGGGTNPASTTPQSALSVGMSEPTGLATDSAGDLYISDSSNSTFGPGAGPDEIYEYTPSDGNLVLVAGGGTNLPSTTPQQATSVQMSVPLGMVADSSGDLYIADGPNYVEELNTPSGDLSIVAGGGSNPASATPQTATNVALADPVGLAIDPTTGDVYVSEFGNTSNFPGVVKLSGGDATLVAGSADGPLAGTTPSNPLSVSFDTPTGIAFDGSGQLYLADMGLDFGPDGGAILSIAAAPTVTGITPSSGPASGGTHVTITGTELTDVSKVDFGTAAATIDSCTATTCVVTSPAESGGTVPVNVITPFGTSPTTTASHFTYPKADTMTALHITSSSANYGSEQKDTLSVQVTEKGSDVAPTGKVSISGTSCSITLSSGEGSCKLAPTALPVGTHKLVANYAGSSGANSSSSSTVTLTVKPAVTTTSLKASAGTVTFGKESGDHLSITVSAPGAVPTGTVSVTGTTCSVTLKSGTATCTLGSKELSIGTHKLTATYHGSTDYAGSSSSAVTIKVVKATNHKRHR